MTENYKRSQTLHQELDKLVNPVISATGLFKHWKDYALFIGKFEELIVSSKEENYYWQYSPFDVYLANLEKRKLAFLQKYFDATEEDFFKEELDVLYSNWRDGGYEDFGSGGLEVVKLKEGYVYYCYTKYGTVDVWLGNDESELTRTIQYIQKKKINYIESLLPNSDSNSEKPKTANGFASNLTVEQIGKLHSALKGTYISCDTSLKHFECIFKIDSLPTDFKPIDWTAAKNLLAYFVDILFFSTENHIWAKAEKCFRNGKNLKQLKDQYLNNKSGLPKGASSLEEILKSIY